MKNEIKRILEPKKCNRFMVSFPPEFNILETSITRINKPKYTYDYGWGDIDIEFMDIESPSTTERIFNIIKFISENDERDKKLFDITIRILDSIGSIIETWIIEVDKIIDIDFGELSYESNDAQQIYMSLSPRNCYLKS